MTDEKKAPFPFRRVALLTAALSATGLLIVGVALGTPAWTWPVFVLSGLVYGLLNTYVARAQLQDRARD